MLLIVEKIIDRVLNVALRLIPGSRHNPKSLESRVRRNWGTYDRARDRATALLADAAAYQVKVEAEVANTRNEAIEAAEQGISALQRRIYQLRNIR